LKFGKKVLLGLLRGNKNPGSQAGLVVGIRTNDQAQLVEIREVRKRRW
jgi:hypothetical protein